MIMFLDHDANKMEKNIDNLTEIKYKIEKKNLIRGGNIEIDVLYEKKIKLIEKKTLK